MKTMEELLQCREQPTLRRGEATLDRPLSTGFNDLDRLVDGLSAGEVWVLAGRPGAGRSVLATQLAARWAAQGTMVGLLTPRDAASLTASRLLAGPARISLQHLTRGTLRSEHEDRLAAAHAELESLQLIHSRSPHELATMMVHVQAVVFDDADLSQPEQVDALNLVRSWCDASGGAAVLTLPLDLVMPVTAGRRELEGPWTSQADLVIEVHRDDNGRPASARAGEADLIVLRNRRGPTGVINVVFQGHYARFIDLATDNP